MIFPPAPPPAIAVDGTVLRAYSAPVIEHGRMLAPIEPFVTRIASVVEYSAGTLIVRRGDRFVTIRMPQPYPAQFASTYVPIAPILRTLGLTYSYDAAARRLNVVLPAPVLATPTPFNPAVPEQAPRAVFTPSPVQTPRPIVTGPPTPRRTPLPYTSPIPKCPRGCGMRRARRGG